MEVAVRVRIVDVAAGDMHTSVLDSHGRVWSFGDNEDGQLGDGTNGKTYAIMTKLNYS